MKILFVGDYSNYNRALSLALRRLGHEVTVASDGSRWMNTARDLDMSRPFKNKVGGLLLWAKLNTLLRSRLEGYDIVQINSPVFTALQPCRLRPLFDRLVKKNGAVYLTAMGTDTYYIDFCLSGALRYNEWRIGDQPSPLALAQPDELRRWQAPVLTDYTRYVYEHVKGVVSCLYEYHESCRRVVEPSRLAYAGIPIDTDSLSMAHGDEVPSRVKLFLGVHRDRMIEKGTDRMLAAARRVVERHPRACELVYVENRLYSEYIQLMRSSHVVLDQLYSYTPATNALLAMAQGLVVVSGAEPEYYDFIGETENRPIVNAIPDDEKLEAQLEEIVLHPERLPEQARRSREFVVKHNRDELVARRFLDFWARCR
ncbi:hypothetical protein [Barnesiella sp. An55]|uniref:hypothetical protein n=1 Tax=Barnesiella sp. An55 TaxID=1965646 RepID=UPI000B36DC7E|nr:hypothetical protein [Barnesiella sp. An55]OUN74023.1 hypothetical protein B5G10_03075 [Barnesiella sp. An55]HIZ25763.1 glycosyltransferase family 1 protein [Candidatus Barnesiella merdipullorum]